MPKPKNSATVHAGLERLRERHDAEMAVLQDFLTRYDAAAAAIAQADDARRSAVEARSRVLASWLEQPGWTAERIAEFAGLAKSEVLDARRAAPAETPRATPGSDTPRTAGPEPLRRAPAAGTGNPAFSRTSAAPADPRGRGAVA